MESFENNEQKLLQEFYRLAETACKFIRERKPDLAHHFPGDDPLEEARFAYRHLADDPEHEAYEDEQTVKSKMEAIKELIPTIPLQ